MWCISSRCGVEVRVPFQAIPTRFRVSAFWDFQFIKISGRRVRLDFCLEMPMQGIAGYDFRLTCKATGLKSRLPQGLGR